MTYSRDFREKVLEIRKRDKLTIEEVAREFGVGKASVSRWEKEIEAKQRRSKKVSTKIREEELRRDVEKYGDGYQYERAERLGMSQSGICYALKRLGMSVKKKPIHTPKPVLNKDAVFKRR
jgi:transposase